MNNIFAELRRRNIFRVAGVYAVVGWLLAQVAATLEGALVLPGWFDSVIVAALLIGFPVALILAWAFEVTPEGVKLTANVPAGESISAKTGRTLDYVIIAGLVLVGGMIIADRLAPSQNRMANVAGDGIGANDIPDASIAVLPFADMSAAGDQEYFADGIAEEILNLLAKSDELKVAGRTSSFQFKGRNEDLRAIGEALGVATILEGSLRKAGDRVRITAQLIRSADGFHLWSETYDRELVDIFDVQEDIARAIARELQASLGLESGSLAASRTENLEAYQYYLNGVSGYQLRGDAVFDSIENSKAAVALDPEFAAAWAVLANATYILPGWHDTTLDGEPINRAVAYADARYAALKAYELNPEIAESRHAIAQMHMVDGQWEFAEKEIERALAMAPNSPAILEDYFEFLEFTGQWERGAAIAKRLTEVDPLMAFSWINLAWARWDLRDHEGAAAAFERSLTLKTRLEIGVSELIALRLIQGDADEAEAVLAREDWVGADKRNCLKQIIARYRAGGTQSASADSSCWQYDSTLYLNNDTAVFPFIENGEQGVLDFLEASASRERQYGLINMNSEPLASVRETDAYKKLVREGGFERYWRARGWPSFCRPIGEDDFECSENGFPS